MSLNADCTANNLWKASNKSQKMLQRPTRLVGIAVDKCEFGILYVMKYEKESVIKGSAMTKI